MCMTFLERQQPDCSAEQSKPQPQLEHNMSGCVARVLEAIQDGTLPEDDMPELAGALGRSQSTQFHQHIVQQETSYKSLATLQTHNYKTTPHNPVVLHFLQGITCSNITQSNDKKTLSLAHAIEQIQHTRCLTYISPLAFTANLLLYFVTKSKKAVNMFGNLGPFGSYTSVVAWLANQSTDPFPRPTDTDVITFVDNNQVLKIYL